MKYQFITLISCMVLASACICPIKAADNIVVIGDSLSKEYALEFPLLNPSIPAAWGERNWLELLSEHRPEQVDIGALAVWPDSRLTGHEYNFAFPGSTSSEWEEILTSTFFTGPQYVLLRVSLDHYLDDVADRVVIFLGGNDLKNNYGTYYNGADPSSFINKLVSNMKTIIEYVRDQNSKVPIVLVNMPDVGITPTVIESKPDPSKRQLVTNLTSEVNVRLRQLATSKGIGYADIEQLTAQLTGPGRFVIGGVQFLKSVDPGNKSNDPEYLFSPDGFHPNTNAQLLFANEIARAFRDTYPNLAQIPPFSTEEMLNILGIAPDVTTGQWAEAYGLSSFASEDDSDGDGVSLFQEFAFNMDPRVADAESGPVGQWTGSQLELRYQLRVRESTQFTAQPEFGINLKDWTNVPAEQMTATDPGQHRAWVAPHDPQCFLRLNITGS